MPYSLVNFISMNRGAELGWRDRAKEGKKKKENKEAGQPRQEGEATQ